MKNFLYVHGYHGNANGHSINVLRNAFGPDVNIIGVDYDENDINGALIKISNVAIENNVDTIIGSSFGGFLVLLLNSYKRIVINPCMMPSVEIPLIDPNVNSAFIEMCKSYEGNMLAHNGIESRASLFGFFGDSDELLGNRYHSLFKNNFGYANNFSIIHSGHHISNIGAAEIVNSFPSLNENVNALLNMGNASVM